jgi:hypothetical protein
MHQPKDLREQFRIIGLLLQMHQIIVQLFERIAGFGQKIGKKIIHSAALNPL